MKNKILETNEKKTKIILNVVSSCGYLSKLKLQEIKQRARTNKTKNGPTRHFFF